MGVGRKPNASMSPGPDRRSACPSDLVWNKDVNALIASSFIFPAGRGGFASRRDVQHKRAVKIAEKLAHSVRVPFSWSCTKIATGRPPSLFGNRKLSRI